MEPTITQNSAFIWRTIKSQNNVAPRFSGRFAPQPASRARRFGGFQVQGSKQQRTTLVFKSMPGRLLDHSHSSPL